jgi:glutathionylspermidine synthase
MNRLKIAPRRDWQSKVEAQGLLYHTPNGKRYWDEGHYYSFTMAEILMLETSVATLQSMCLAAAQHVIDTDRFDRFGVSPRCAAAIERAWKEEPPAVYGRFDLAYDGYNAPKLLEYNADTPTSLLEAAVIQWYWMKDVFPEGSRDQWNSIHERLVAKWRSLHGWMDGVLYFAHVADATGEDLMTASYLRDTASEAGIGTMGLTMPEIAWSEAEKAFVDKSGVRIKSIFKLYPWEWMVDEEFADHLFDTLPAVQWIEPIWKMLWSNKALLPLLWELFPDHPLLLPASFTEGEIAQPYVKKPKLGREGGNITIVGPGGVVMESTPGDYGADGYIYQSMANRPQLGGTYAVLGAWVIDGEPAGMGLRESNTHVTGNLSRFVPHVIEG